MKSNPVGILGAVALASLQAASADATDRRFGLIGGLSHLGGWDWIDDVSGRSLARSWGSSTFTVEYGQHAEQQAAIDPSGSASWDRRITLLSGGLGIRRRHAAGTLTFGQLLVGTYRETLVGTYVPPGLEGGPPQVQHRSRALLLIEGGADLEVGSGRLRITVGGLRAWGPTLCLGVGIAY